MPLLKSSEYKCKCLASGYNREYAQKESVSIPVVIDYLISIYLEWIDSKILTDKKDRDTLLTMIENHNTTAKFKNCKWKLLFRASRDGYSPNDFHNKCDGKGNTVCIIKTEYNHIAGGYTEVPWSSPITSNPTVYETKFVGNAYIFSIAPKTKIFEQKKDTVAVTHSINCGFNFGYWNFYTYGEDKSCFCHPSHINYFLTGSCRSPVQYINYEVFRLTHTNDETEA